MTRLAVLASGQGTLLEAIRQARLSIELVLTDRRCRANELAREWSLPCLLIDRDDFYPPEGGKFDRPFFTSVVVEQLEHHQIDVVAMAGWMTILSPAFVQAYEGRALNIHPSLLPKYPGAHAVRDALAAGETITGFTIHQVTGVVDEGPIEYQQEITVPPGITHDALAELIRVQERIQYPKVLRRFCTKVGKRT